MPWRDDVVHAVTEIGGLGHLNQIYASVERIRRLAKEPLPNTWKAIVRRELEYNSSDSESYQRHDDLFYSAEGLGKGIWGLRSMLPETPAAIDLEAPNSIRVETLTYRILRDTKLARQIKKLHKDTFQLCGKQLKLSRKMTYSEAHHIQPLGAPHNGPDVPGNIIVVCPTCHVLCDFAAIELKIDNISKIKAHSVDQRFLNYHNARYLILS
jgi:hypothetical protein